MKKITKGALAGVLAVGLGFGGLSLTGCLFDSQDLDLRVDQGYVQWTKDGETWENLISVDNLKGKDGADGKDGNGIKSSVIDEANSDATKTTYVITFDNGTTFTFEVENGYVAPAPVSSEKIEIYEGFKSEYNLNEQLDVTGGILTYTDETGKEKYVAITEDMVSGFVSTSFGERNMVVEYEGNTILYPYTIVEPAFAEYGVPYYCYIEPGENGGDVGQYGVFYFNEDGTISVWTTQVLPTLNNHEELFKTGYTAATFNYTNTYAREIVDNNYVITMDEHESLTGTITMTIVDKNTISAIHEYQDQETEMSLVKAGNEDALLAYGEYYVADKTIESISGPAYMVAQINNDGTIQTYILTEKPNPDTIEELINEFVSQFPQGVIPGNYYSVLKGENLTIVEYYESIDNKSISLEYNTATGALSWEYNEQDTIVNFVPMI